MLHVLLKHLLLFYLQCMLHILLKHLLLFYLKCMLHVLLKHLFLFYLIKLIRKIKLLSLPKKFLFIQNIAKATWQNHNLEKITAI